MSYLKFDKSQLVNLEYSLGKELLRTNRAGSYSCTTIVGCNTRKYHGLLICPLEEMDNDWHLLISSLDETVIQHDSEFNLGIHKYPGDNYYPKGHKYVRDYEAETIARTTYRVGGVVLLKEYLLVEKEEQVLIRYTLVEAHSPTRLRFKPFLAFRNVHALSKANMDANTRTEDVKNGIRSRLYPGYPNLYMQFSKKVDFVHFPDWYYNIEYMREQERGYDYQEDLFVPGYFELEITSGESIVFSASLKEGNPQSFKRKFEAEIKKRIPRNTFRNCLINAAHQFIVRSEKKTEIIAGYPWFGSWGRDTFISLPGLTLAIDDVQTFRAVTDTMLGKMQNGLFPNMGSREKPAFNSVDAPLWFFWSLQQYATYTGNPAEVWKKYGKSMKAILDGYRKGQEFNIHMNENGLIYAGEPGKALTWMDAVIYGKPVTPRTGYQVEINALWYNAIMFSLELAQLAHDTSFTGKWKSVAENIRKNFEEVFWDPENQYLADYVDGDYKDWAVRPNMLIAVALPYSPVSKEIKKAVLDVTEKELLTPKGLRSLSPKNSLYKGIYLGNLEHRDNAYHQGSVWPWLLEPFCRAYLDIYKAAGLSKVKKIYMEFEEDMSEHGISSISEIYDGDPPHKPRGAISQAWSIAALLRISKMIEEFEA